MGRSNDAEFVELVWKNEKKILKAQSPKDLREGIESLAKSFQEYPIHPKKLLMDPRKDAGKTSEMFGLSYDFKFPEDHALKNQLWKNVIQRKLQAARENLNTKNSKRDGASRNIYTEGYRREKKALPKRKEVDRKSLSANSSTKRVSV